ncbi:MAG: orotate phosphoribosyltransferase [Candidatus Cloacimonadia bacterium]
MKPEEIKDILYKTGAILKGHFLLTSGLHSEYYIEKIKLIQYPVYVKRLCTELTKKIAAIEFDVVVSPAMGAIVLGYEVAKQLGKRFVFTQRLDGVMKIRSGFDITEGDKVMIVEDVTTTGGSVFEVIDCLRQYQAVPKGVGLIVDRSGGTIDFGIPTHSLLTLSIETYKPEACPLCDKNIPISKPGSTGK